MTAYLWLRATLLAGTAAGIALTVSNLRGAPATIRQADQSTRDTRAQVRAPLRADSLAAIASARDPFRLTRRAAAPYRLTQAAGAVAIVPMPRPPLALAGIVLGSVPVALIDGIPGADGTVVLKIGERHGAFLLRAIRGDAEVVAGPDTVWTLHVRSPR